MDKQVIITNGVGTSNIVNGTYDVTADVPGYDNSTLEPKTVNITDGTNEYNFTIAADCTATLHVTDNGTASGNPIEGAIFIRTDSEGNEYGDPISTNESGDAVFENVPEGELIYFKQTSSDGDHEFDEEVQNITLTSCCQTFQIINASGEERTIYLTDANYENLPIESATLTFNNNQG